MRSLLLVVIALAAVGPLAGYRPAPRPAHPDLARVASDQPPAATRLFHGKLDLNLAGEADLLALPGIGPVRARAIVAERSAAGHFTDVDELRHIPGVGKKTMARIRPFVEVPP